MRKAASVAFKASIGSFNETLASSPSLFYWNALNCYEFFVLGESVELVELLDANYPVIPCLRPLNGIVRNLLIHLADVLLQTIHIRSTILIHHRIIVARSPAIIGVPEALLFFDLLPVLLVLQLVQLLAY